MHKKLILLIMICAANLAYADTETIKWYVDGNEYTTTTCQTGGNVNIPNEPTKTGYTFQGWKLAYDYSQLDYTINGTDRAYNAANRTWTVPFNYGVVSGVSLCSVTPGNYANTGTPDTTTTGGQYCWCMATGYTPAGENIVYENTSSSPWVFASDPGSASSCASLCAGRCGYGVLGLSDFRRPLFGA